jgi:DNA-binding FadR family transcriptional regulator
MAFVMRAPLRHPLRDSPEAASESPRPLTMVEAVAKALAAELAPLADGSFLGSEDQLSRRFGLSKPTLRQAARLLEHRELLVVKRGVNGGYYARRPSVNAVAASAAAYLSARGTTHTQLIQFNKMFNAEAAKLAAAGRDPALRRVLADVIDRVEQTDASTLPVLDFLSDDDALARAMTSLAENPVLDLLHRIIFDFGSLETLNRFMDMPERRVEWRAARLNVARAVLEGDAPAAEAAVLSANELLDGWLIGAPSAG